MPLLSFARKFITSLKQTAPSLPQGLTLNVQADPSNDDGEFAIWLSDGTRTRDLWARVYGIGEDTPEGIGMWELSVERLKGLPPLDNLEQSTLDQIQAALIAYLTGLASPPAVTTESLVKQLLESN